MAAIPSVIVWYELSDAFFAWLATRRPGAYRELRLAGVTACDMSIGVRYVLRFGPEVQSADDFDRQIDSPNACLVLAYHPELLARTGRPKNAKPADRLEIGAKLYADPALLSHLGPRRAEAEVLERDGDCVTFAVKIRVSVDEIRVYDDPVWEENGGT